MTTEPETEALTPTTTEVLPLPEIPDIQDVAMREAERKYEVQGAIILAKNFPRNEDDAFQRLMRACQRPSFADDAVYAFPRGGQTVEGPSVVLAREAARVWKNIRYGVEIIRDDEESRQIRGWAWDMETNTKVTAEDDFEKKVYRKKEGWIKTDERDLRELSNRRGAILVRNCLLQILPRDLIEDAMATAKATTKAGIESDPEAARKKLIMAFSELNVTPEMLEKKLGHPLAQCSPAEIAELRKVYKSIADGNSTWFQYAGTAPVSHATEVARRFLTPAAAATTADRRFPTVALPIDAANTKSYPCAHDQGTFTETSGEQKCVLCGVTVLTV